MAILLMALLLADLASLAFPFVAYYLWREWDRYEGSFNDDYAQRCLYGLIAVPRLPIMHVTSKEAIYSLI